MNTEDITILCVDDEKSSRYLLNFHLKKCGFNILLAGNGVEALKILENNHVDLIISDHMMPEMDGIRLLKEVKSKYGDDIPFIMVTAYGSIENAVISIKEGAYDYIQKPYNADELLATIKRALDHYRLGEENRKLKVHLRGLYSFQNIVTKSPGMIKALKLAEKVAKNPNTTVSLYGESGTGKEVFARAIHYGGERMENRFVAINCAGIPSTLLESELFGYAKGAFTGADKDKEGKFDLAQKGTLLLDEIGDMPLDLQTKLLRVLEEHTYERLGSNKPVKADFRIITATHRNLTEMVKDGKFREDLYHRINIFPIALPSLRERREDIPLLVDYFLEQLRGELGKHLPGLSQKAMDLFLSYNWLGNIRELKNCLERAAILSQNELIRPEHLTINQNLHKREDILPDEKDKIQINIDLNSKETTLDSIVDHVLQKTLEKCNNNKSLAADMLKVNRKMFYRREQKPN
ncbi:MAG: sigma-54-dependent Fis family transcriptional regulator [Nitrospinae bacterium]|nr:sigma-54-dependent Fis family transcriptional regulator [Nitrospinota bacterium]